MTLIDQSMVWFYKPRTFGGPLYSFFCQDFFPHFVLYYFLHYYYFYVSYFICYYLKLYCTFTYILPKPRAQHPQKRVRLAFLPARSQGCVCAIRRQGREQPKRKATRKLGNAVLSSLGCRIWLL